MLVAPNPFEKSARVYFVSFKKQSARLELFDLTGRSIKMIFEGELQVGEQILEVDGNGLIAGVYLLKMTGNNGNSFCMKIVKY